MSDTAEHTVAETPAESAQVPPGQALRQAREARGLSQQQVASQLRLSVRVIDALERDDYAHLPSATFVNGYLRSYSRLLNLPLPTETPVATQLDEPALLSSVVTAPQSSSRSWPVRLISVLLLLVVMASVLFWWFGVLRSQDEQLAAPQEVPIIEDESGLLLPVPMGSVTGMASEENPPASEPVPETPPETPPAESSSAVSATTSPEPPVLLQAEMRLSYDTDSWTEITDNQGERLAYGLVEAGQTLTLRGEAPFSILLGYAPGVTIYFNGEIFDHSPFQRREMARFRLGGPEHNRPLPR